MTKNEYTEIWTEHIQSHKFLTVGMVSKMYDMLFTNDEPTYPTLKRCDLILLITDLEAMYYLGQRDGVYTALGLQDAR